MAYRLICSIAVQSVQTRLNSRLVYLRQVKAVIHPQRLLFDRGLGSFMGCLAAGPCISSGHRIFVAGEMEHFRIAVITLFAAIAFIKPIALFGRTWAA